LPYESRRKNFTVIQKRIQTKTHSEEVETISNPPLRIREEEKIL
jgi:hypothetical protein